MPWKPKKPCLWPGCPVLVERGYCAKHRRMKDREDARRRGTAPQRGYDRDWKKVRDAYAAAHPFCEDCLEEGVRRPLDVVDHIVALRDSGKRLDWSNLRSLCNSHHQRKHARERSG